jgi:hypothetical protein
MTSILKKYPDTKPFLHVKLCSENVIVCFDVLKYPVTSRETFLKDLKLELRLIAHKISNRQGSDIGEFLKHLFSFQATFFVKSDSNDNHHITYISQ